MAAEYMKIESKELPAKLVKELIKQHHDRHWHLQEAKIGLLWVTPDKSRSGKIAIASARCVSGLLRFYTGLDFIIEISRDYWKENLSDEQRRAVIDHELCHCGVKCDKDGSPVTVDGDQVKFADEKYQTEGIVLAYQLKPHDYQAFHSDITAMAANLPGLDVVVQECKQLELEFKDAV